jgi:hypothetical protein
MQVEQYYSDDYAGLKSGNISFYYGYEVEDELTGDSCFNVVIDGKEVFQLTTKKIEESINNRQLDKPQDYLIAGIGIWLLLK